jgi:ribosome-associated protein
VVSTAGTVLLGRARGEQAKDAGRARIAWIRAQPRTSACDASQPAELGVFAVASTEAELIRVTRSVVLPRREIELRFSRSSGPGGQHAQRTESRVEAVFDVAASTALTERQKQRVIARRGPVLRAVAQDERSQWANRELAVQRLVEALREALRVRRARRATAPTQASVERRLAAKRRRAQAKRLRKPPVEDS